ncbi:MAG: SIMPL domain-containing protein [Chloroflexota bacterium]
MRTKFTLMASITILALVLSACAPKAAGSEVAARTISVNGTGTVYLTPDIAYINIGVHTEDPQVGRAVDMNNQKSQDVINAIKGLGVEAKDIQTTNFSVYNSVQYDPMSGLETDTIYMVDNTVIITIRDLTKMSDILDASIRSGANNINSVSFDISDKTGAVQEARLLALKNAHTLASELTKGAGVTLGDVQTLSYFDYSPSPYYGKGGLDDVTAPSSSPINPGQMQLSVDVSIVYEIK